MQPSANPLAGLADIVVPGPVPWTPQTWGWPVLAVVLALVFAWSAWTIQRRRLANRYRMEALAALDELSVAVTDIGRRAPALLTVGELLKRTALTAFPREDVARLSGSEWVAFLNQHAPSGLAPSAVALLDDLQYREPQALRAMAPQDALEVVNAARAWIKGHRVSA
jgi:hypothetical protein